MDAISVKNLSKRYKDTLAVDDISFTLATGGVLGLLGGNGAGKTTTISMLLGLLVPSSGSITVLGHDMAKNRFAALARMNFSSPYIAIYTTSATCGSGLLNSRKNSTLAICCNSLPVSFRPVRKPGSRSPNR
jgi:ABC-type branched-subunit amino acid transport system ATPase component